VSRDVVVSAGASEPRSVIITEKNLVDLSDCTFKVQLAAAGEEPTGDAWEDAAPVFSHGEGSEVDNVATVPCTVAAPGAVAGHDYRICVQLTDGTNIYVLTSPEILHAT
jgi:hypothetical protein